MTDDRSHLAHLAHGLHQVLLDIHLHTSKFVFFMVWLAHGAQPSCHNKIVCVNYRQPMIRMDSPT